jgi:HAMP domain-containing protein
LVLFAADVAGPARPGVVRSTGVAYDLLLVFGAGVLLFGVLLLWAAYFRRQRSQHHRSRHRHHQRTKSPAAPVAQVDSAERDEEDSSSSRHRRRRRRREHRGRNPTLSETGGLPPPRADGAMPPAA